MRPWGVIRDSGLRVRDELLSLGLLTHLLAFLVLPALHLTHHQANHGHTHTDTGSGAGKGTPKPTPAPAHGHGALEHFSAALTATESFVFVPAPRLLAAQPAPPLPAAPDSRPTYGCAQPRGPPTVG